MESAYPKMGRLRLKGAILSDEGSPKAMSSGDELEGSPHRPLTQGLRVSRMGARLNAFLSARSPGVIMVASILLLGVIWSLDVLSGPRVAPSLFYTLPVLLVTWRCSVVPGVTVAFLAAAWVSGDLVAGTYDFTSWLTLWSGAVRFTLLAIVALLNITIRGRLKSERDLAVHEAAVADRLREINDVKDTLMHAVSHDLKGPITAILGSARSLGRRDQLQLTQDDEEDLLGGIIVSGQKLNQLVNGLLDFQRLDSGLIEPDRRPTDLGAMADRLVKEADYLGQHPTRVVADSIEVSVDGPKVERILENLLRNAAKHTPPGTPVLVRIAEDQGGVLVSVEDEGSGVPDELKDVIFRPFRQGAEALANRSGSGLGLSLVAKFAGLHAGSAWVEDRPGGGSAFRVYLPGEVRRLGS